MESCIEEIRVIELLEIMKHVGGEIAQIRHKTVNQPKFAHNSDFKFDQKECQTSDKLICAMF